MRVRAALKSASERTTTASKCSLLIAEAVEERSSMVPTLNKRSSNPSERSAGWIIPVEGSLKIASVAEHRYASDTSETLLGHLQSLYSEIGAVEGNPSDVATWPSEAFDYAGAGGIAGRPSRQE
jgi:hypothetical protein